MPANGRRDLIRRLKVKLDSTCHHSPDDKNLDSLSRSHLQYFRPEDTLHRPERVHCNVHTIRNCSLSNYMLSKCPPFHTRSWGGGTEGAGACVSCSSSVPVLHFRFTGQETTSSKFLLICHNTNTYYCLYHFV